MVLRTTEASKENNVVFKRNRMMEDLIPIFDLLNTFHEREAEKLDQDFPHSKVNNELRHISSRVVLVVLF